MLTSVLKAKYFPNSSFWTTPNPSTRSIFWSSIMQVKIHLHNNTTIQLHAGSTSIWSAPWCPSWDNIHDHLLLPVNQLPLPATVSQLWLPGSRKELPPLIKTFTWRLIRRAIATGARIATYSTHIDEFCSVCGAVEDDAHLFFHCQLPRAVWSTATPPIRPEDLP